MSTTQFNEYQRQKKKVISPRSSHLISDIAKIVDFKFSENIFIQILDKINVKSRNPNKYDDLQQCDLALKKGFQVTVLKYDRPNAFQEVTLSMPKPDMIKLT
jgi:hypothetical protein